MIITKLKEGLGNQLFQFYFTRNLNSSNYKFDCSFYRSNFNRQLDLLNYPNLKLNFLNFDQITTENIVYVYDSFEFIAPEIDSNKTYIFDGYWQNKKYIENNQNLIYTELTPSESQLKDILLKYPFLKDECISIHIRRGDYIKLSDYYYCLDAEYYRSALDLLPKNIPILVFSDDMDWCKANLNYKNMYMINNIPRMDLQIMSMCTYNIIANSTFSFWGAFLNRNLNKKVIAPIKWIKKDYSLAISNNKNEDVSKNIIFDDWIRI
jgi:hypothetical protein